MTHMEMQLAPPGLKGLQVADTKIGSVRGNEGFYHYRQFNAVQLARTHSLEDIWLLVMDGELPTSKTIQQEFQKQIASARILPKTCLPFLAKIAQYDMPVHLGLQSALPAIVASARPTLDSQPAERRLQIIKLVAAIPTILSILYAQQSGAPIPRADPSRGHAEDWLTMASGKTPSASQVRAVETYMSATIDHGFNASTFAVRVVTSTGADVVAAISAGLGALSGPLHGGAPSRALAMIQAIGDPSNTEAWIDQQLSQGRKIMGFGHAVYRVGDPRSTLLKEVAQEFNSELVYRSFDIEKRILRVMRKRKPNATIVTNVEYYAGLVLHLAGLPPKMFTPTFMVSRAIGWGAHILEQAANNKIFRPSARYVGPSVTKHKRENSSVRFR